jgi:hypothetical protein
MRSSGRGPPFGLPDAVTGFEPDFEATLAAPFGLLDPLPRALGAAGAAGVGLVEPFARAALEPTVAAPTTTVSAVVPLVADRPDPDPDSVVGVVDFLPVAAAFGNVVSPRSAVDRSLLGRPDPAPPRSLSDQVRAEDRHARIGGLGAKGDPSANSATGGPANEDARRTGRIRVGLAGAC